MTAESCTSQQCQPQQQGIRARRGPRAPRAEMHAGCLAECHLGPSCWAGICSCLKVFTVVLVTNSSVFRGDYLVPKLPPGDPHGVTRHLCRSKRRTRARPGAAQPALSHSPSLSLPISPSCSRASLTLVWCLWQTDLQGALLYPWHVIPSS